ncbi:hypothetical protein [Segniliparus rugosus]|uniref:hypothetical protein n=1 Tax=Segniliparus rugosus TaxID=286804 RepID=UPI0001F038D6|nr:hypothetical protein [Segniliparus rugosus]
MSAWAGLVFWHFVAVLAATCAGLAGHMVVTPLIVVFGVPIGYRIGVLAVVAAIFFAMGAATVAAAVKFAFGGRWARGVLAASGALTVLSFLWNVFGPFVVISSRGFDMVWVLSLRSINPVWYFRHWRLTVEDVAGKVDLWATGFAVLTAVAALVLTFLPSANRYVREASSGKTALGPKSA